ncbi:MAG: VCBS repeat-containing protein [Phycisphaeraceae bacterium]|nr:VCBS repeat-containing protein [Phycisphaeraceae bacterium]
MASVRSFPTAGCVVVAAALLAGGAGAQQADCLPDRNGDGHPIFGVTYQRADREFTDDGAPYWQYVHHVSFADLNGSGSPDMVVALHRTHASGPGSRVSILLNRGDGVFDRGEIHDVPLVVRMAVAADVDGDGVPDVLFVSQASDVMGVLLGRGDGTFGPPTLFAAGGGPCALAVADFDGDGLPDVATMNAGSRDVSLLRGLGGGAFAPETRVHAGGFVAQPPSLGPAPTLAAGDINGDGLPDLAFSNGIAVRFLVNEGGGGFTLSHQVVGFSGPGLYDVRLVDLNGDGSLDVAASIAGAGAVGVGVGLNAGDGTFPVTHLRWEHDGALGYTLGVGDTDGDGVPDVLLSNEFGRSVYLLPGLGDGTFGEAVAVPQANWPWIAALEDVNGDGRADIIVAERISRANLNVTLNDGTGGFHTPGRVPRVLQLGYDATHLADFDGDGVLDLVVHSAAPHVPHVHVLRGDPQPGFTPADSLTLDVPDVGVHASAIGDLNGNGVPDVVVSGFAPWTTLESDGYVWVILNPGGLHLGEATRYDLGRAHADSPVIADFDGDGLNDLAFHEGERGLVYDPDLPLERRVTVFLNNGDGTLRFHQRIPLWVGPRNVSSIGGLAAVDLNGDGRPDLVSASASMHAAGRLCVLVNDGAGTFSVASCEEIGNDAFRVVAGDFGGDGVPTVAVLHRHNQPSGPYLSIFRGDGAGGLTLDQAYHDPQVDPVGGQNLVVADCNGDGRPDIVFRLLRETGIVVHFNDGAGGFQSRAMYDGANGGSDRTISAGKLTGGRSDDLLVSPATPKNPFILFRNLSCAALCPADLDGDGATDGQDVARFLDLWLARDPRADWDRDGVINTRDVLAYLNDWAAGCP